MKINKVISVLVLGLFALPDASFAGSPCRGEVPLQGGDAVSALIYGTWAQEGEGLTLSSPITMDTLATVGLTIQKVIKTSDGLRVFATYDRTNLTGFLTFESRELPTGEIILTDFKGFEAGEHFGPAVLNCDP